MARIAKSLDRLRSQVNAAYPKRSKVSDGWIADARHVKAGTSDHIPNKAGVVTALDLTHDPANGLDARKLAETLVASKDRRIKYLISNGQIVSSKVQPWVWRKYTGANAHRHHVHISVDPEARFYDDTRDWNISASSTDSTNSPAVQDRTIEQPKQPLQPTGMPIPIFHTVVKGDTLSGLAKKYGESVEAIRCFNGKKDTVIKIGEILRVK